MLYVATVTVLKRVDWNDDVLYQHLRIETSDTANISDIGIMDPLIAYVNIIAFQTFDFEMSKM